jgi:molybdopterin adenylyltransferase
MKEFEIVSVNISKEKGTVKVPIEIGNVFEYGIAEDAHAGKWHRQISLLAKESIDKFGKQANRNFNYGEFAENITTQGISLLDTAPLDIFEIGDVILEVTQLGKKCHGGSCAIYREVGNCVMPKEGIFTRVVQQGILKAGLKGAWKPKTFKVKVITLSDRASEGIYEDLSGPAITENLKKFFEDKKRKYSIENIIISDNQEKLINLLNEAVNSKTDFIFTTGGTGIGQRDITPDVILNFADKEISGVMDMIRIKYGENLPAALLSRSVAATKSETAIFALPGSVKAVNEYMSEINKNMFHILFMLKGLDIHA